MKLALGLPWYSGPDDNVFPHYMDFMAYLGALRERSVLRDVLGKERFAEVLQSLPPLDEGNPEGGEGEPTEKDWEDLGRLSFGTFNRSRLSMVGKAREMIVEDAMQWGADWLLWWDADMLFPISSFLQLWRNKKMVCGALAFTARHPVHPVIYRMRTHTEPNGQECIDGSDIVMDYPRERLVGNEEVGGELAFGAGMVLYNMKVFREMPQPWFNSTGCGEDWFFCHRASKLGIPRYVDTRVKTWHKEHGARWVNEDAYWTYRKVSRDQYEKVFGPSITVVREAEDGRLGPVAPDGKVAL